MQSRVGRHLSVLAGVLLIAGGAWGLVRLIERQMVQLPGTLVATPLPEVTITELAGRTVALAELRGRPVLINFWATWCPPCREEMPALERVERVWRERGAVVLAVNFEEDGETIRRYLAENGLTLPVYQDGAGVAAEKLDITYLPTTLFVDGAGTIRSRVEGPLTRVQIETGLRALLAAEQGK